jgi:ABC-2 type transport system ATP-binding protein
VAVVEIQGLTKRYGSALALDGLDLEVHQGEVLGYLGPNGAGKSTTLGLLLGQLRPTAGRATIFGLDAWGDAATVHRRLAYVPSEARLWPSLTGAEVLAFLAGVHGSVDEPYRDALVERFELDVAKRVRAYSHGNRQKVLLVAALATRADLLLLDEPTTGLDPLMEQVFRGCVREARDRGQTVLLSSHILSEVEAVADRVAMLRSGRLIDVGTLDALRSLAAVHVRARLDGPPPSLDGLEGVTNVVVDGCELECDVHGRMEPLLAALAASGVAHLSTRDQSLEELFVVRYGRGTAADPSGDGEADGRD